MSVCVKHVVSSDIFVTILSFVLIISSGGRVVFFFSCFIVKACFFVRSGLFYFLLVFPLCWLLAPLWFFSPVLFSLSVFKSCDLFCLCRYISDSTGVATLCSILCSMLCATLLLFPCLCHLCSWSIHLYSLQFGLFCFIFPLFVVIGCAFYSFWFSKASFLFSFVLLPVFGSYFLNHHTTIFKSVADL